MTDLTELLGKAVVSDVVLKPPAEASRDAALAPARDLLTQSLANSKAFSIPVDSKQAARKLRSLFKEAGKTSEPPIRVLIQEATDGTAVIFQGVKGRVRKEAAPATA
jgi:hypothetical protein